MSFSLRLVVLMHNDIGSARAPHYVRHRAGSWPAAVIPYKFMQHVAGVGRGINENYTFQAKQDFVRSMEVNIGRKK
jgi:hypothetical protein